MATIAKGMITLVNVNDAYTVSATPNVCAIKADFDGTHPVLDDAYCDITVVRGDVKVPFTITSITPSHAGIKYEIGGTDATKRLALTDIPVDALSGTVTAEVATEDEFVATVIFQYSVMRESTMLDWIKDWENNKTTIGSTYLITPKLFVGKKVEAEADLKVLTGVYIGPDSDNGAGIYGYKQGEDIFHINETGGHIGGWDINNGGIQTEDGTLKLLSEGSIISSDKNGNVVWGLYKSGEATFAQGNVIFYADGSAEFAGTIISHSGVIGGWYIGDHVLKSRSICFDANHNYVGVAANSGESAMDDWDADLHTFWVHSSGGVKMYWNNANDYGLEGYLPMTGVDGGEVSLHCTFKLGNQNFIAGWHFDDVAIWTGDKMNTAQQYTSGSGSITLGSMGLRGNKWYIDSNGDMSFMGGKIKFSAADDGGEIVGWKLNPNRLSTNNVALVSDGSVTGLYMSASADANFNSRASASLENFIDDKGGIYINISDTGAELAAYDQNGKKLFKLKSDGESTIANWNFDNSVIYTGDKATTVGFTANDYSITISTNGLLGYKWKLLQDGSGAIAGGNIAWDTAGNVTIAESVKIGWSNLGGTIINSEGVFAGKISADNITAGTISTANITNKNQTWYLNQDGSGALANGNVSWKSNGEVTFTGKIIANSGSIGGFEIQNDHIGVSSSASDSGDAAWAALSIYKDFFKVGGAKGYVMFGDDVIPAIVGGAFTAVGRIVNQAPNTWGSYGFDQANYGLFIDVTGGTKNYGISSNAALMAPAFINTKAKILTFVSGQGYTLDFSQHNIILMYYYDDNYSGTEVTLPTEASVARQFGLSSLPNDFATIVTFRVRPGSKPITLKGIYNANESSQDYKMDDGDSIMVLISKVDGFRYQILNHAS